MRFLFTFAGGSGHFLPTVPLATILEIRGHDVAYACQAAMRRTVEEAGFTSFVTGGNTLLGPTERRRLAPADRANERRVVREVFAGRIAVERARQVRELAAYWHPDVIVRDEMDLGAAIAAESLDLAHADVTVIAAGGLLTPELVADPLTAARADFGLAADPTLAMLHRYLTLTPVPPSFRDPTDPVPATAHHLRPAAFERTGAANPARTPGDRKSVYFTLGTVFHQESGDLFTRVLAGLKALDVDVLVTVGREVDPAELGPQPAHIRVERFVPVADALATCNAVISHAGSGTVVASLAYGLPSVLLPMGADQPWNADRCRALGVSEVLDVVTASVDDVSAATREVLHDPGRRAAAERVRDEIEALPDAAYGADLLERLGSERRPIPR